MVLLSIMIFLPIIVGFIIMATSHGRDRYTKITPLVVALINLILAIFVYGTILTGGKGGSYNFVEGPTSLIPSFKGIDYYLGIDGLSGPLILLTTIITVLVVLGSWDQIKSSLAPYYGLILFFEGAIIGVFTSLNLVMFFIFWELVLVPMFFFIGIWGGPKRKYAAMKFFIYTHVGSMIMLLGFIALFLFTSPSTFNINELMGRIPFWLQILASITTFIGFGVKLPIVPFHTWLPDAHVEAPAPISVFLAALLLKMGGYGFLRLNLGLFPDVAQQYAWIYISIGLLTMSYGAIVALFQKDLKRMIALTSINHMGFVLLGAFTGNALGVSGAVFQMFNHGLAIGLLFMLSGYIHKQAGTRDINLLKGLKFSMPRTSVLFIMASMAGMGVPLFSNFLSEYMVIVGAISIDARYAVAMLIPGITAGYFLWTIRRSILSAPAAGTAHHDVSGFSAFHLSLYLIPLIITLIFPWIILDVVDPVTAGYIGLVGG